MPDARPYILTILLLALAAVQAGAAPLKLSPCKLPGPTGEAARCGTYSVYENRETRQGRTIDLKVVVLPATGPDKAPDPIFMIAGGPGQGAATIAPNLAGFLTSHRVRRDIVFVDQRGTGGSNQLQCGPAPGEDPFLSLTRPMFNPAALRACRESLSRQADLTQYTTVQAVEDLDEVRAALGYDKVNLLGGSYGSRVALVYLRQRPERVRSAVAWSIAPTDMANPLPFARNAQRALEGVLADCEADAACRAAFPKVREQFRQVMARLESGPVTAKAPDPAGQEVTVSVDKGWIAEAVRYVLYSEDGAHELPLMIDRAAAGDFGPIVQIGLLTRASHARNLAMGMLMSVVCSEDIPLIRPEDAKKASAGTFLGDFRVRQQIEACREWPRARMPPGYSDPVRSDLPVLLLSGEFDPATSPQQAEGAIRTLSRARHVVIPDGGHGASSGSGECFNRIVVDFLDAGDASRLDTSCLSRIRRPPFATPAAAVTVLRNIAVIDNATGTLQPDMAVELSGDRIQEVVPAAGYTAPEGARIVASKGRFLLPGFVEMHAHVLLHPWDDAGQILPRYDRGTVLEMLRLMLAHGITTVRDPGSETEAAITLRNMIAAGEVTGPTLRTAGRILNQSSFNPEPFAPVQDEKAIRDEIRWQAAAGVDFIKVYAAMRPDLMKIAIDEAHAHKLPVIGHLHRTTWTQAAELGIDMVTHAAPWSPEYLSEVDRAGYDQSLFGRAYWVEHLDLASPAVTGMADAMAKHGISVDPTLIAMHTKLFGNDPRWLRHPQLGLVPELFRKGWPKGSFTSSWTEEQYRQAQTTWPKMLALTKLLHDRGVLLTVGTDTPTPWIIPGVSFHEEMGFLRDAGIPAKDVLRMATLNGARALRMENTIGAIQPGMRADLVVLRANPLEKIENAREIEMVIQGGKIYEPRELIGSSPR